MEVPFSNTVINDIVPGTVINDIVSGTTVGGSCCWTHAVLARLETYCQAFNPQ